MLLGCVHNFGILLVVFIFVQWVVEDVTASQACVGRVTSMKAWMHV